jgi:hypothetical protein
MKSWTLDFSATPIPPMSCRLYGEVCLAVSDNRYDDLLFRGAEAPRRKRSQQRAAEELASRDAREAKERIAQEEGAERISLDIPEPTTPTGKPFRSWFDAAVSQPREIKGTTHYALSDSHAMKLYNIRDYLVRTGRYSKRQISYANLLELGIELLEEGFFGEQNDSG